MSIERVEDEVDSTIETYGRPVDSDALQESIDRALSGLRGFNRNWQLYDRYSIDRMIDPETDFESEFDRVREATPRELQDVEDRVSIVPGTSVADTDLRIEKRVTAASARGPIEVEIDITNISLDQMSGLVVREYLQFGFRPVSIDSDGVYRDSTVTWVVNGLEPLGVTTLRLRVSSDGSREFESETEISAITAVRTQTEIRSRRRTELPVVVGRPDVRMKVEGLGRRADVMENLEIPILLKNVGDGVADAVVIRVTLPLELDHHQLDDTDFERALSIDVRNIKPDETRSIPLRIRATESGSHRATIELMEQRERLERIRLTIDVRQPRSNPDDDIRSPRDERDRP